MFDMNQDYFDSRDVIDRIEELESMEDSAEAKGADQEDIDQWSIGLEDELARLKEFAQSVGSDDWEGGMTFIADSYFTEYAEDFCKDVGYLPHDLPDFVTSNINWAGVADDLRADYSEYELDGNTYYARD